MIFGFFHKTNAHDSPCAASGSTFQPKSANASVPSSVKNVENGGWKISF